jgi:hypothetical protein
VDVIENVEGDAAMRRLWLDYLLCDLDCYRGTHWVAKVLRLAVFAKIWPHQALLVKLT